MRMESIAEMGIGPILRLMPMITFFLAIALLAGVILSLVNFGDRLATNEFIAVLGVGCLPGSLLVGVCFLLQDMTEAVLIDDHRKTVWVGGGWFGRWEALPWSFLASIRIREDNSNTEFPWVVEVVDLDRDAHVIRHEYNKELAEEVAQLLRDRLELSDLKR